MRSLGPHFLFLILQMQYSISNLLRSSLVPELTADIATGSSCNVHLCLVTVVAVWTLPNKFAVIIFYNHYLAIIATNLTVVRLSVKFGVHNVVVDKLDNLKNGLNVVLHIWHFNIANSTTSRECLELTFKLKLIKRINRLCYVYMIAVCNIVFIGNSSNNTKPLLKALSKLVSCAFKWSTIDRETNVSLCLPLISGIVHSLHDFKCKWSSLRVGV